VNSLNDAADIIQASRRTDLDFLSFVGGVWLGLQDALNNGTEVHGIEVKGHFQREVCKPIPVDVRLTGQFTGKLHSPTPEVVLAGLAVFPVFGVMAHGANPVLVTHVGNTFPPDGGLYKLQIQGCEAPEREPLKLPLKL
jgi:hypothetical protein